MYEDLQESVQDWYRQLLEAVSLSDMMEILKHAMYASRDLDQMNIVMNNRQHGKNNLMEKLK